MLLFTDWQPVAAPEGTEESSQEPAKLLVDKIELKAGVLSQRGKTAKAGWNFR